MTKQQNKKMVWLDLTWKKISAKQRHTTTGEKVNRRQIARSSGDGKKKKKKKKGTVAQGCG